MDYIDGVNYLSDKTDVKILLCYVLTSAAKPVLREILIASVTGGEQPLANYFDVNDALSELVRDGFIAQNEDGTLSALDKAVQIAATFNRKIPVTVREKAVRACIRTCAALRSRDENPCEIVADGEGFAVICRILENGHEILSVRLSVADRVQAESIKKQFSQNPMLAYTGIVALLTDDIDSVGGALLSKKYDDGGISD